MPVIPIVGDMGFGKTTYGKQEIRKCVKLGRKARVLTFKPEDFEGEDCEVYGSLTEFLDAALGGANEVDWFDEGEIFIPVKEPVAKLKGQVYIKDPLKELLAGSRAYNRIVYIVFHSIADFRKRMWLLQYCNGYIRFNTQDKLNIEAQCFTSFPGVVKNLEAVTSIPKFKYYYIPLR